MITRPVWGGKASLKAAEVSTDNLRQRVLNSMMVPILISLGLTMLLGVTLTLPVSPLDPVLLAGCALIVVQLVALVTYRLPFGLRLTLAALCPVCLGWLMLSQVGLTVVPGLFIYCGAAVMATLRGLKQGLALLALGWVGWISIGWAHYAGLFSPRWRALVDPSQWSSWLWNGALVFLIVCGSVLFIGYLQALLVRAIRREETLSDQIRDELEQRARSERAHAEAARATARTRDAEALGRLASGVAHDFNNALMVVLATAELSDGPNLDADAREALSVLRSEALEAAALNKRLLTMSRPVHPHLIRLNLNEVLQDSLTLMRPLLPRSIGLETRLSPDTPHILGDATRIGQLLLIAALQARDQVSAEGQLIIETEPDGRGDARLRFVIQGATETPEGLFDLSADAPRPPDLVALEQIVSDLRGRIQPITPPQTQGPGAELTLPGARPDQTLKHLDRPKHRARRLTVLLAEDEAPVRRLMARTLAETGYSVVEAADGQEALDLLSGSPDLFDLLCTDGRMPRLDGPALVESTRRLRAELPILVCSAFVEDDQLQRRLNQEDVAFLSKPFEANTLLQQIDRLMEGQR